MNMTYDPNVEAASIRFTTRKVDVTVQRLTEDSAVHDAPDGSAVGIEVLAASRYLGRHRTPHVE